MKVYAVLHKNIEEQWTALKDVYYDGGKAEDAAIEMANEFCEEHFCRRFVRDIPGHGKTAYEVIQYSHSHTLYVKHIIEVKEMEVIY